jgi:YD repeat-containing protein
MFENMEIRKAANGFILAITTPEGDTREYVYDTSRKLLRVLKQYLDVKETVE